MNEYQFHMEHLGAPEWVLNAFGLIWLLWCVSEFRAFWIIHQHPGQVRRGTLDRLKLYTFVIITIVWFSWRIGTS